jgi:hypothetical protein
VATGHLVNLPITYKKPKIKLQNIKAIFGYFEV